MIAALLGGLAGAIWLLGGKNRYISVLIFVWIFIYSFGVTK